MSKFRIPKRFKLFGKTIEVKQSKDLSSKRDLVGSGNLKTHTIEVQIDCDGYEIKDDEVALNFFHELTHFILYDLELKLEDGTYAYRDEQCCSLFGLCLHQVLTTMEYDDEKSL